MVQEVGLTPETIKSKPQSVYFQVTTLSRYCSKSRNEKHSELFAKAPGFAFLVSNRPGKHRVGMALARLPESQFGVVAKSSGFQV